MLGLTIDERRERAAIFEADAEQLAGGDDDSWNAMFQETAMILERVGFYFDRAGSIAVKLGEFLVRAQAEALRQRAALLRGSLNPPAHDRFFADIGNPQDPATPHAIYPISSADDRDLLFSFVLGVRL